MFTLKISTLKQYYYLYSEESNWTFPKLFLILNTYCGTIPKRLKLSIYLMIDFCPCRYKSKNGFQRLTLALET